MRSEALKGHLDVLILAVVADRPRHGYAIIEDLKQRSGGSLDLPEGTVYPALHRLEAAGFLSSAWGTETGRRRRVYELTRRGRRELGVRRSEWRAFSRAVEAVLGSRMTQVPSVLATPDGGPRRA
ncbi:MAG: PadR family transcriptional regulator, regulatory protein PadR [Solirubrobacteraceae bacterium]|jgi:transcriptional regulator|nr:PadR family transcriptional regulator, regulatory protein PadR [Solirubrobacteraceae bacterium]